jgi:hypothetical protein
MEADQGESESGESKKSLPFANALLRRGKQDDSLRDSQDGPSFVRVNRRYEKRRRSSAAEGCSAERRGGRWQRRRLLRVR